MTNERSEAPMRPLFALLALSCLAAVAAFAAAPPAPVPAEWLKLIDQLGDDDADTRKSAEKELTELGEGVLPALRKAGEGHADVDVRLRATAIAAALEKQLYGEVRRFTGHADGHVWFSLSPDGKKMVSGCWGP